MNTFLLHLLLFLSLHHFSEAHKVSRTHSYIDESDIGFDLAQAVEGAKRLSRHSWEYGATAQALLEVYNPELSVFSKHAFPSGSIPNVSSEDVEALHYLAPHILVNGDTLANGDGANGDPASLGVGALLLGVRSDSVKHAATRQIKHLYKAPLYFNGAISQREGIPELWADGMFMIPPFLAYYAVATQNESLLRDAIQQCRLYRQVLRANTSQEWNGLWVHIVGPASQSLGIWSTGNGWAALGLARVLGTVKHWKRSADWEDEQHELIGYMMEIFTGLNGVSMRYTERHYDLQAEPQTGLLRNYLVGGSSSQNDRSVKWFGEGAGSAALVAAALRLAVMEPAIARPLLGDLKSIREAVISRVNSTGYLEPTVNPLDWFTSVPDTNGSPEGQAFISMMGAAWRDCVKTHICTTETLSADRRREL
ncbi:hypothetical protein CBS101457_000415 [Exobasidium rhododendri]|nr:hypothetical protein CBS101457_000415 [Exobasidium rhododendri]